MGTCVEGELAGREAGFEVQWEVERGVCERGRLALPQEGQLLRGQREQEAQKVGCHLVVEGGLHNGEIVGEPFVDHVFDIIFLIILISSLRSPARQASI